MCVGAETSTVRSIAAGDYVAEALIGFIRSEGAAQRGHGGERALLDHLVGTYEILHRWNQPAQLQHAALLHSVYGTDVYGWQSLPLSRRGELRTIAGAQAERLAYLFSVTPRGPLFAGTHLWARDLPTRAPGGDPNTDDEPPADRAELDALVLLHMANLAEQARAQDGSPGRWLVKVRDLAELLIAGDAVTPPPFVAGLATCSEADESLAARAYRTGVARAADPDAMANHLALAAATCPAVPEPCVWMAHLSLTQGDPSTARGWARHAQQRLRSLGTAWDKRLTFDEWLELTERLQAVPDRKLSEAAAVVDPRTLFDAALAGSGNPVAGSDVPAFTERPVTPADAAAGRQRFHRYVETFADAEGPAVRGVYPELVSQPWFNPSDFPLVSYLESHSEAIRDEILALESRFQRESERITRAGDWDVVFLYERGRRRDDVCDACPVTTVGIESHPTMRTVTGLIYASRMRPGTHIQAHRGPTNLRVRCHLGIKVPDGDCAIRVGDHTQQWRDGRCLVFDDYFEHEAWNHTEEDRIILIVDLWHPGLSATEVRLLEGLHTYTYQHARQLNRYWSSNAQAAANRPTGDP